MADNNFKGVVDSLLSGMEGHHGFLQSASLCGGVGTFQ